MAGGSGLSVASVGRALRILADSPGRRRLSAFAITRPLVCNFRESESTGRTGRNFSLGRWAGARAEERGQGMVRSRQLEVEEEEDPALLGSKESDELKLRLAQVQGGLEQGKEVTKGSERQWNKLCSKYPQLKELNETIMMRFIEILTVHGVAPDAAAEIALKYPPVLSIPTASISKTIMALMHCGFNEEHRQKLLRKFPHIFAYPCLGFPTRMAFLGSYFENSKEALKAVTNSVEALIEPKPIVERKLRFLIMDMSHSTSSIKNCDCLSYPLHRMKIRHHFLIRAGLYQPIPYKNLVKVREKEKGSKTARPRYFKPEDIVSTSDNQFLKTCVKGIFTINDLVAFEEVYNAHETDSDEEDEDYVEESSEEMPSKKLSNSTDFGNVADTSTFYF